MKNLIKKSWIIILLVILVIDFFNPIPVNAQQTEPTFIVRVGNCKIGSELGSVDNFLQFDINIQHTNFDASGAFKLALNQYFFHFNPGVANGGTLTYNIVSNSSELPPHAMPQNPLVVGSTLNLASNGSFRPDVFPPPVISTSFPGTRVATLKFQTSAALFAIQNFALAFTSQGFVTKIFAFIGATSTNITANGTYEVETGFCLNQPLPVELASFNSSVNKNIATLNWSTSKETNNSGFDIERKLTLSNEWVKAGYIAGGGNLNEPKNYTFSERMNSGKYNYRLKQIDFNGNYEYFQLSNEVIVGIPEKYDISQNYPNPFNPTTKIDFELPHDGNVSIVLYDITGREIAKLVNEVKTAGYYTAVFNASNFASGIYFYRIESGDFVQTKKMLLMK